MWKAQKARFPHSHNHYCYCRFFSFLKRQLSFYSQYLAILELAAKESEAKVDEALRGLLEKGEGWVRAEAVRERLRAAERKDSIREVEVARVDLRMFDELCESGEVLQ